MEENESMKTILNHDKITLELSYSEAQWLKERMRNCAERYPADEPVEDKKHRINFFGHLPNTFTVNVQQPR